MKNKYWIKYKLYRFNYPHCCIVFVEDTKVLQGKLAKCHFVIFRTKFSFASNKINSELRLLHNSD